MQESYLLIYELCVLYFNEIIYVVDGPPSNLLI